MSIFVFPGQGSQFLGMSKDFHDNFDVAKITFEEIEDYTSTNLRKIIFSEDSLLLNQTNITQIAIFASSMCIFNTLKNEKNIKLSDIDVMLGHSLGEYTALACSEKLSIKDTSMILKKRGELMNNALEKNVFGMYALIGKSILDIENIIKKNNLNIDIANDNSPIQVVVSGKLIDLDKYGEIFKANDVKKYIKLNVSSAFHSHYMLNAQEELNNDLDKLIFKNNSIKIISNYSSNISDDTVEIKNSLQKQMASTVKWRESILNLEKNKLNNIIEIGPGNVLSGLIKRISNYFDIKNINSIKDLENFN